MGSFPIEADLSESDETKPLVANEKKPSDMQSVTANSTYSGGSDLDDTGMVDKYCSHMSDDYKRLVSKALKYIDKNLPTLNPGGSSGSYFIHGDNNKLLGVFKPEDEEPYGINNPKWGKWFQKVLFPCSFGRGCLVPNQGYVSEAAAYLVDGFFGLNIVPATAVVLMSSKVFSYSRYQRYEARAKQRIAGRFPDLQNRFNWSHAYKKKKGSFQLFVENYIDAEDFTRLYPMDTLSEAERYDLTVQIQKMFVLDYIIRNTDRLNANYMVNVTEPILENTNELTNSSLETLIADECANTVVDVSDSSLLAASENRLSASVAQSLFDAEQPDGTTALPSLTESKLHKRDRKFTIACIDNGLAFPFHHPSGIRSYPFSWSKYFPYFANQPFLNEVKESVLHIVQDVSQVKHLCDQIRAQLDADKRYQKKKTIESQLAIVRGQMYNLLKALENNLTPAHLELQTPLYANELKKKKKRLRARNRRLNQTGDDEVHINIDSDDEYDNPNIPSSPAVECWKANYGIKKHTRNPYFSCC